MYAIEVKGDIIDDSEAWFYDWFDEPYTSPKKIKDQLLNANNQPIKVKINSGGGSVFSASEIYTELKNYENEVLIEIQGLAGSAASVIAMSGNKISMSPVAQIMIHNASCTTSGDKNNLDHTRQVLNSIDEMIANAYVLKTNLKHEEVLEMMNKETWLTAQKAKELGFCDEIIFDNKNILSNFSNSTSNFYNFINSMSSEKLNNLKANLIHQNTVDFSMQQINLQQKFFNIIKNKEANMKFTEIQLKEYNNMLEEAQIFLNNKDLEGYENKIKEIEAFENECEKINLLQANLNAKKEDTRPVVLNQNNLNSGAVISTIGNINSTDEDITNTVDYRKAFMNHIVKGSSMPEIYNDVTKTTDAGVLIPKVIVQKIIEDIEKYGNLLELVTRTSYPGGVIVPTANFNMTATWPGEGNGSTKQKKTIDGSITFTYHKLRCAVSVTLETSVMALDVFEKVLISNISKAMVKALEEAIINGTGINQPKGILAESAPSDQDIDVSDITYQTLVDAESALPMEYENNAIWVMTKKTFMKFVGMVDSNGQPIARVNYGIGGKPERSLLGRRVELTNHLKSFDTASTSDKFAFIFDFSDYVLNTNYEVSLKRYEDNDTDDVVTKSIMIVDGKPIRLNSLVTLSKQ